MAELAAIGATLATAASSVPAWVPVAASATSAAVGAASAYGANKAQGQMAKQTAEYNARELERAAGEERAAASRKALAKREEMNRVLSTQRAVASASGAGTSEGEGYLDLVGDTAQRGEYYSDLEIASGENKATGMLGKAAASRWKGEAEQSLYDSKANAALVKGAFDVASVGVKGGKRLASSDDLMDTSEFSDGATGTWTQTTKKARGRYY